MSEMGTLTPPSGGIGVLGGTFNPIHRGHLHAALAVAKLLDLERVVLIPAAVPPLKQADDSNMAPAAERLAWTRMAVAGYEKLSVDSLELERDGPSYTVDTLRILAERWKAPPVFLIGQDAFADLASWREPAKLLTLSNFVVMTRPPVPEGTLADWLPASLGFAFDFAQQGQVACHRTAGTWIRRVVIDALDISSTQIRQRLREGKDIHDLVPDDAAQAIVQSGCYSPSTSRNEP